MRPDGGPACGRGRRGSPGIVGADPDGRGDAATAPYGARVCGTHSGMALATARRLCPQAIFLRGNFREYERVSLLFHRILRDYSPLVESTGLDEAFLDLTGCAPIIDARRPPGDPHPQPPEEAPAPPPAAMPPDSKPKSGSPRDEVGLKPIRPPL